MGGAQTDAQHNCDGDHGAKAAARDSNRPALSCHLRRAILRR
jgi:hypothetical protein